MKVRLTLQNGTSIIVDAQPNPNYARLLRVEALGDDGEVVSAENLSIDWKNRCSLSKDSYADPIWLAQQKRKEHANTTRG